MPRRNPPPPAPPRRPGPPSNQRVSTSLARVRQIAKSLPERERSFDPARAPTWRGSSRDLVVNGEPRLMAGDVYKFTGSGTWHRAHNNDWSQITLRGSNPRPNAHRVGTRTIDAAKYDIFSDGHNVYAQLQGMNRNGHRRNGEVDPRDIPANLTPIKSWGYLSDPPEANGEVRTYSNTDFGRSKADNNGWFQVDYATGSDYSGGSVNESNYRVLGEMLENAHPEGSEPVVWARTRGGHGTYGIIVNYGDLDEEVREAIDALENYPLMDEEDHSRLEMEQQEEAWKDWGESEFIKECAKHLGIDKDDFEEASEKAGISWYTIFHAAIEGANLNWEDQQGAGQWINMERAADQATDYIGGEKFPSWVSADTVEEYEKLGEVAAALQE